MASAHSPTPHMLVSVGGIVLRENKVLLTKASYRKSWTLPTGYVETGESLTQVLEREIYEETKVKARLQKMVAVRLYTPTKSRADLHIVFRLRWSFGEPKPDGVEVVEARFVAIQQALRDPEVSKLTKFLVKRAGLSQPKGLSLARYRPSIAKDDYINYSLFT